MHLFIAREAVDKHLEVAGALDRSESELPAEAAGLPPSALFYALLVSAALARLGRGPSTTRSGRSATHLRFAERSRPAARARGLPRHAALRAQARTQAGFLFRAVDVAIELFAMTAAVMHAQRKQELGRGDLEVVERVAFAAQARVRSLLRAMSQRRRGEVSIRARGADGKARLARARRDPLAL